MACRDCPEPAEKPDTGPQHAVRWRAWYTGGRYWDGCADFWPELPDDGVLAVRVEFSDGTARLCSGNDWYGLVPCADGFWTIAHNDEPDNAVRYPTAVWKRGQWTSEAEMQRVNAELMAG